MTIKTNEPGAKRTKGDRLQLLARERVRVMSSRTKGAPGSVRAARRNMLRAAGDALLSQQNRAPA